MSMGVIMKREQEGIYEMMKLFCIMTVGDGQFYAFVKTENSTLERVNFIVYNHFFKRQASCPMRISKRGSTGLPRQNISCF